MKKITHISERKTRAVIRHFNLNIEAKKAAELIVCFSPDGQQVLQSDSQAYRRTMRSGKSF